MPFTCQHCAKEYKTQGWLTKHLVNCQPVVQPVAAVVSEVQPVVQPVVQPAAPSVKKEVKLMTPQERTEHLATLITKGIVDVVDNKSTNHIFNETFEDGTFYFSKISADNAKRLGINYNKALDKCLTTKTPGNIFIERDKPGFNGSVYRSFGSLPYNKLNTVWKKDYHLYELLEEERKPYFDIEFRFIDDKHTITQLNLINEVIKKAFSSVGVEVKPQEHYAVAVNFGICKSGTFKGLKKVSYHIIINNGYKFKSVEDAHTFNACYIPQIIEDNPDFKNLYATEGLSIDTGVYTINRAFKLPYQSKANDNRPQIPDTKFSKCDLRDFLISYGISEYTPINMETVVIQHKEKIKRVRERVGHLNLKGNSWNFNAIDKYLNDTNGVNIKCDIPGDVSVSIPYLVNSIYNGREVSFNIWFIVGSAIKRCVPDYNKALDLFVVWTRKYDQKITREEIADKFDKFAADTCGFKTLLSLARLCNDKLDKYISKPWLALFDINTLPVNTQKMTVDKRYINYNDFLVNDTERHNFYRPSTYFIKSPMGTGKTYNFSNYFKDMYAEFENSGYSSCADFRVLYLSSRRAFAEAVEQEFRDLGFVNYMKVDNISEHKRVIISVESLRRLSQSQIHDNTILIIDESESIFNIVSSETLSKNDLLTNINALNTLIQKTPKVFIMDAFLSNRSVEPIVSIRNMDNVYYYQNDYKYDVREYYESGTLANFQADMITNIKNGKKCVAVVGSRNFGKEIMQNLNTNTTDKRTKFYNCENPLNLTSVVNNEWAGLDLLMYSPTITCGISYDNPDAKFDNLYIYAVNKGSCHFRDVIQAHKRVRQFNNKRICVCLNTDFTGFNLEQQPIYKDEIVSLCSDIRAQLFYDETTPASIRQQTNLEWVMNIHAHNILERNIHQIYLEEVAACYFEKENIKKVEDNTTICGDLKIDDRIKEDWQAPKIPNIDYNEYIRIYNMINNNTVGATKPTAEEYKQYIKYIFKHRTGDNYNDTLFNDWHEEDRRKYVENIKCFKEMLFKGYDTWVDLVEPTKLIEFRDIRVRAFKVILDICKDLKIITNTDNTYNKINTNAEFNTADFDIVVERLKNMDNRAINQLFVKYYYDNKDDDRNKKEFTTKTTLTIFKHLLIDYFGYEVKKSGECIRVINGVRRKLAKYTMKPQKIPAIIDIATLRVIRPERDTDCVFSALNGEWYKIGISEGDRAYLQNMAEDKKNRLNFKKDAAEYDLN